MKFRKDLRENRTLIRSICLLLSLSDGHDLGTAGRFRLGTESSQGGLEPSNDATYFARGIAIG